MQIYTALCAFKKQAVCKQQVAARSRSSFARPLSTGELATYPVDGGWSAYGVDDNVLVYWPSMSTTYCAQNGISSSYDGEHMWVRPWSRDRATMWTRCGLNSSHFWLEQCRGRLLLRHSPILRTRGRSRS